MVSKLKKDNLPQVVCEKCGKVLTPTETRVYNCSLYGIEFPNEQDKRKLCLKCKGEKDER